MSYSAVGIDLSDMLCPTANMRVRREKWLGMIAPEQVPSNILIVDLRFPAWPPFK